MILVVEGGEVHAPGPRGVASVLCVAGSIVAIGQVDRSALDSLGVATEVLDARGRLVIPGLLDPHQHLLGGSGERGPASQTPEIFLAELALGGLTTVVGCLGVDTITRTMPALLAKARALGEEGISAYLWTGGYDVPPATLTGSVRRDMLLVPEVIGAGEIAISDVRDSVATTESLARLARDVHVGGILTSKAGLLHLHVGDLPSRLAPVRALVSDHGVERDRLYPTHVERSADLLADAAALTREGFTVDVDVVEHDLVEQVRAFLGHGGDPTRLTASSDAAITSPGALLAEVRRVVRDGVLPLERALALVTTNTARTLRLERKGRLAAGCDADLVVVERGSLEIVHVVARGRVLVRDGTLAITPRWAERSDRVIEARGRRA